MISTWVLAQVGENSSEHRGDEPRATAALILGVVTS
jgi:hypothetical protein